MKSEMSSLDQLLQREIDDAVLSSWSSKIKFPLPEKPSEEEESYLLFSSSKWWCGIRCKCVESVVKKNVSPFEEGTLKGRIVLPLPHTKKECIRGAISHEGTISPVFSFSYFLEGYREQENGDLTLIELKREEFTAWISVLQVFRTWKIDKKKASSDALSKDSIVVGRINEFNQDILLIDEKMLFKKFREIF